MRTKNICQITIISLLIAGCSGSGVDNKKVSSSTEIEQSNNQGSDPLMIHNFAKSNNLAEIKNLLANGVDVNAMDEDHRTALMYASFEGYTDIMQSLILAGAKVDIQDLNGRTALMFSSSGPFPNAVKLLLESGATTNIQDNTEHFTALMYAAAEGHLENIKLLIEYGADPSLKDVDGDNALVFARNNNHQEIVNLLQEY